MAGIVSTLKKNLGTCFTSNINKKGCRVLLDKVVRPYLIVDLDHKNAPLGSNDPRCDYLFFADDTDQKSSWVVPIELKGGGFKASEVFKQLQAGAKIAEKFVAKNLSSKFCPILFSGEVNKYERDKMREKKVKFHNHREFIRVAKCGQPLQPYLQ